MRLGRCSVIFLLAGVCLATVPEAEAQEWAWPEKAENLQSLPEDTSPERLRAVMTGFSRALGVRCHHCHVGEPGAALSEIDFVSDDNPNKEISREMLAMLGDINQRLETLREDDAERVNMWCHTCHRGAALPTTLGEELDRSFAEGGVDAALEHYRKLRERFYGQGTYDFSESALNNFGYGLLEAEHTPGAIAVFTENAIQFPRSPNVWDSLAEAHLASGEADRAAVLYRKVLDLDPENEHAAAMLDEIGGVVSEESGAE